jgi:hypothetical protein
MARFEACTLSRCAAGACVLARGQGANYDADEPGEKGTGGAGEECWSQFFFFASFFLQEQQDVVEFSTARASSQHPSFEHHPPANVGTSSPRKRSPR